LEEIAANQLLHEFVAIQLADQAACVVVTGDVSGVFTEQITNDLVYRVISLLVQSIEHAPKNPTHIFFVITGDGELNGVASGHDIDLLSYIRVIIA
jgi:hypothetical protein